MVKISKEYFVELSQDEALQYIGKKEKSLNRKIELLSDQIAKIKAHIVVVSLSPLDSFRLMKQAERC